MAKTKDEKRPILVKKVKKMAGGHHGGAWKVAYADFVTAMMAFFMLLWLLNVSEKETLDGLAEYFTPSSASVSGASGSGKPLGGTALDSAGAMGASASITRIQGPPPAAKTEEEASTKFEKKMVEDNDKALQALEDSIRQAIQDSPELAENKDQILLEQTPDGVRIQLTDKDGRSMFRDGTAEFFNYAQRLVREIGGIVAMLPNRIAIMGHTNSGGFSGTEYTNWELSADRANSARRVLASTGVSSDRFSEVVGKAETDPLFPTAPNRAENRRITILVLKEAPVVAPNGGGSRR